MDSEREALLSEVLAAEKDFQNAKERLGVAQARLQAYDEGRWPDDGCSCEVTGESDAQETSGGQSAGAGVYAPAYSQPYIATKDHVAAGLLAIFLGAFGVHKFYLGYTSAGFTMLGVSIVGGILSFSLATWVVWAIAIIEGILYLAKSQTEFEQIYLLRKQAWF